jgi:hypothetical protein
MKRYVLIVLALGLLSLTALSAVAQDIQTKGSIRGTVTDPNGAVISGATVVVTGASGERTTTTNSEGAYEVANLTPGSYTVKITQTGFKTASVANNTVYVGKTSVVDAKLEIGASNVTVDVTAANEIDQGSTATSSNLNDQLFQNIPVARGVSSLFYLAPGTTDGLGGGRDNPSISGGSALDNLYIADGVNITDSGFGGIGTFSRSYGALGTGINTSFIKEVQVKTAGFEPQYGQSQGGIVNIITQSGGNDFHGALYGYATPKFFEATAKQPDDFPRYNPYGKILHNESYDAGVDFGGPIARDKLFFFGSFNPSVRRTIQRGAEANSLNTVDSGLRLVRGPAFAARTRSFNYAGKVNWELNKNHEITFSIFGDPSKTNKSTWGSPGTGYLNADNTTGDSILDYGTRNMSVRYNGTWSNSMTFNASLGLGKTHFNETGFDNFNQITDRRGSDALNIEDFTGGLDPARGNFSAIGRGFVEPTHSKTNRLDFNFGKIQSLWGQHTFGIGYTYQRGGYDGIRDRSGPHWTVPNIDANGPAAGQDANVQFRLRYRTTNCSVVPNMPNEPPTGCALFPVLLNNGTTQLIPARLQVIRAEFGLTNFKTFSDYHAAYAQDTWRFNKYVTANYGIRWEQERMTGSPSASGVRVHYTLTDQWAPRVGVTVDPFGRGRTKAFWNFGRFFDYLPLDLAERSLSSENDWTGTFFLPEFTVVNNQRIAVINQYGTVNPIIDQPHQLTVPGSTTISTQDPANVFAPGTKLGFTDEQTIGFEQQLPKNWNLSVRYIYRNTKRITEDSAILSPEAALSCDWPKCENTFINQVYAIANVGTHLDAFTNLVPFIFSPTFTTIGNFDYITNTPSGCATYLNIDTGLFQPSYFFQNGAQSVCFAQTGIDPDTGNTFVTPDGVPDGFPNPVRKYKALEIELNRRFVNGWQAFFNWRIASLRGNFEGHLRNDNGQTDPGISSLFDFTAGDLNLLGDQFAIGPLNSDRRHIISVYGSYSFGKDRGWRMLNGLNTGFNVHFETGLPINELNPHPVYLNTGEIPVGGRGSLGRTPNYIRFDAHTDYAWRLTERSRLRFTADFFNLFNSQKLQRPDENAALDFNASTNTNPPNKDFFCADLTTVCLKPRLYYPPFNMRLGVRWEF